MRNFSWEKMWAPTWPPSEVIFRAVIVYFFVHLLFRILGRKEWTRYSVFNVVVLFLISVALRTTLLGEDSSLTSALISISTIFGIDWLFSYLTFKSERFENIINGKLIFLIKNGQLQTREMRRTRISRSQLMEQIRLQGRFSLEEVQEALLERSGHISIRYYNHLPNRDLKSQSKLSPSK